MRPRKNCLQLMESFAAFSLLLLVGHLLIVLRIEAADAGALRRDILPVYVELELL